MKTCHWLKLQRTCFSAGNRRGAVYSWQEVTVASRRKNCCCGGHSQTARGGCGDWHFPESSSLTLLNYSLPYVFFFFWWGKWFSLVSCVQASKNLWSWFPFQIRSILITCLSYQLNLQCPRVSLVCFTTWFMNVYLIYVSCILPRAWYTERSWSSSSRSNWGFLLNLLEWCFGAICSRV